MARYSTTLLCLFPSLFIDENMLKHGGSMKIDLAMSMYRYDDFSPFEAVPWWTVLAFHEEDARAVSSTLLFISFCIY